jgi:hypothetical protein
MTSVLHLSPVGRNERFRARAVLCLPVPTFASLHAIPSRADNPINRHCLLAYGTRPRRRNFAAAKFRSTWETLKHQRPANTRIDKVNHHVAVPYREIPALDAPLPMLLLIPLFTFVTLTV